MIWRCRSCRTEYDLPDAEAERCCPNCGSSDAEIVERQEHFPRGENGNCPVCCSEILADDEAIVCPDCKMAYHKECWEENMGCATYGCPQAGCLNPPTEQIGVQDLPPAWAPTAASTATPATASILCPKCHTPLDAHATFCWSCGADLNGVFSASGVTTLTALKKFGVFAGRAGRREFWSWFIPAAAVYVLSFLLGLALETQALPIIVLLLTILPTVSVTIRRLHDTGRCGWWTFAYCGQICWFIRDRYDELSFPLMIFGIGALLVLLFFMALDSSPGDNDYGPEP